MGWRFDADDSTPASATQATFASVPERRRNRFAELVRCLVHAMVVGISRLTGKRLMTSKPGPIFRPSRPASSLLDRGGS
jgi:hypothetical protein